MHPTTDVRLLVPLLFGASAGAGVLGALTGLGGGVVIVPLLTLAFGVNIRYAIGASLVSVMATSSGAAAAYLRAGYINIRVAMLLEIATTAGALAGAHAASLVKTSAIVFGVVLAASALISLRRRAAQPSDAPDRLATRLRLDGTLPTAAGPKRGRHHGTVVTSCAPTAQNASATPDCSSSSGASSASASRWRRR